MLLLFTRSIIIQIDCKDLHYSDRYINTPFDIHIWARASGGFSLQIDVTLLDSQAPSYLNRDTDLLLA